VGQPFNPFDFSLGGYTGEEVRQICLEAIERGQASERAKKAARKRCLKYLMLGVTLAGALSAATLLLYR
jgi:hypothetical protein